VDERIISLVRTTFKAVAAQDDGPEKLTRSFYAVLFSDYPGTRDFFPAAMDSQRDRLVAALAYVVDELEDLDRLLPYLARLGRDHRKYGVEGRHYTAVEDSLIRALRNFAGTEMWTDEVDQAWLVAVDVIAGTMIAGADAEALRTPAVWGGTVVQHRLLLRNLAVVRLRLNEPMWYEPGQYVSVQIPARPRMWRYLSPAAPANEHGEIEFHVRAVSSGWVSPSIVGYTKVGDQWHIGAPMGDLSRLPLPGKDVVMIGCGTGIAPMRAQVLAMSHRRSNPKVHLFLCGYRPCDLYDVEVLWRLSLTNPWLTVTPVAESDTNPWWHFGDEAPAPEGMHRRALGQIGSVVVEHGNWSDRNVQIAGSPSMVQKTKFRLIASGVPKENIHHDPIM